ncbi:MAG TPA: protein kinase [Polyangiaceae bacterium]|nr:protein kinase [Polyangiaceae bacterium]
MLGTTLAGKYRIERLLGEGGMGAVYEAVHLGTHRRVALKVILGDAAHHSPDVIARFVREAKAAGAIDTQHIVQVLDFGIDTEQGIPYLAMEFLAGEDLDHVMERLGPLSPELAIRIVAQACVGLQKAHEAGVVHRDIKPANLYLARRDGGEVIVKILDFGIAKVKLDHLGSSENQKLTRTGSVLGSPRYMSPEQAKGLRSIDHRTDIWSLGAVLYQALSGRTPHHDQETLGQLIISICSEAPASIQDYAPWVSPELAAVVRGTLTMDVEQRTANAPALLQALKALQPGGFSLHESMLVPLAAGERARVAPRLEPAGVSTSGAPMASPAVTAGGLDGTQQSLARTTRIGGKSSAPLWLAAAAVVLAGGGGAGYWALLRRHAADGPTSTASSTSLAPEVASSTAAASSPPQSPTSAPAIAQRIVRVGVAPAGVTAEVDGVPVEAQGGVLELRGALGSTHQVLLRLAGQQLTRSVAITENGALPDKLELVAARTARAPSSGKSPAVVAPPPAVAATAATKPPVTAKPAAAKPSGLDRNFE